MTDQDRTTEDPEPPLMTGDDLTDEQRGWLPASLDDVWEQWPAVWKTEMWDGAIQLSSGGDPPWDWRSVAMAARAYPGWRVELVNPYRLAVVPPWRRAGD